VRTTTSGARTTRLLLPGLVLLALTGAAGTVPGQMVTATPGLTVAPGLPGGDRSGFGTDSCGRDSDPALWDMLFPMCNRESRPTVLGGDLA
jgi:hypothetical protein